MKQYSLLFVWTIMFFMNVAAQSTDRHIPKTREDWLRSSRTNRNTGWVLLGGGVVLMVGGGISIGQTNIMDSTSDFPYYTFMFGFVSSLSSIPFFIVSGTHARKAAALSGTFKIEPTAPSVPVRYFPAFGLKMAL